MSSNSKHLREFDKFRIDLEKKVLWHESEPVHLPAKAVELLCVLIENQGEVVTKDEILDKVWRDSFVEESVLAQNIHHLRKTFKDLNFCENPIQTIPRRGYRFAGEVYQVEDEMVIEHEVVERRLLTEISEDSLQDLGWRGETENYKAKTPRNKSSFGFVSVLVLSVLIIGGFFIWKFDQPNEKAGLKDIRSIAVLPLRTFPENENEKTLSLGLTDTLISKLGGLNRFAVRSYSVTQNYKAGEIDPLDFARKLKVDAVLEGSLQAANNRLRVNFRLLRVGDGAQIWAGSFDENETDIFKLQDSLSAQIADSLIDGLSPQERQQLTRRPTDDFEAYKLYLRARHVWNKRTPEGFWESIRLFQAAIDRDPTFALAHAGLADAYVLLNDYNAAAPDEAYPKAKAAARKALDIDPDLVEPRTTLAYILATYDWNFTEAEHEYRRVIETNPNYATAHQWYGEMLYATKRFAEAEIELKRAAALDPLIPIIPSEIGVVLYYSGKYDEAIAHFSKLKQEYPNFSPNYLFSSWCYEQKQMHDEAFADEIVFWKLQGVDETTLVEMERAFRQEGYTAYLHEIAEMLEKSAAGGKLFHDYRLVHIYGRLRDREKVFEWLEKGIQNRSSNINKVYVDPNFDFLRDDERFKDFQKELMKYQ